MANPEDENIDFEDLNMPGEELFEPEPSEEPTPSDDQEDAAAHTDEDQDEAESGSKKKRKWKWGRKAELRDRDKELEQRDIGERRGERDDEKKSRSLLEAITSAEPYTVMLAVALLAIVIAVFCLWLELWRYGFDVKAKTAIAPASHSGPASTRAAAWPTDVQLTSSAAELEGEIGSSRIT